jgi:succinylarginine dihydrolase
MANATEVNFDGLVGPTHNYSGLSHGNVASTQNRALVSNPREAVLQGLEKMRRVASLGLKQALLPPQERPSISILRQLGFGGSDRQVLEKAARQAPELLSAISSASSMWTANAATVSPSADTEDRKVHFTPANLVSKFHRSLEPEVTGRTLQTIFQDTRFFVHHEPLPASSSWGDEGAANHTRLCSRYESKGVEFFVYGRHAFQGGLPEPKKFPARQTYEASAAIVRKHRLNPDAVVFAQQSPEAIDAGVFHNDVAGVGNQGVYFYHEKAYRDGASSLQKLQDSYRQVCGEELRLIEVPAHAVSIADAVRSYLFNSQLITLPSGKMALILPQECESTPSVAHYLKDLASSHSDLIGEMLFFDLKQSMRNGGGPACLRLRVVLTDEEAQAVHGNVFLDETLYATLVAWAKKHYRDRLSIEDLGDYRLLEECRNALDELTRILGLGSIYPFQRTP